jgi:hypothetical protein
MKKLTLIVTSIIITSHLTLFAQTTLNQCNEAAYALGYIQEGAVKITVNGDQVTGEIQEILWTALHHSGYLQVTRYPREYQVGNYLSPDRYYFFEVAVTNPTNTSDYYWWQQDAAQLIEELNSYLGISVGCLYIID